MKKAYYAAKNGALEIYILNKDNFFKIPPWRKNLLRLKNHLIKIIPYSDLIKIRTLVNNSNLKLAFHLKKFYQPFIADYIIISIGRTPRSEIFQKFIKVNHDGFIKINPKNYMTNLKGIFACGDVIDHGGPSPQASIAAGSGQAAGFNCIKQLLDEDKILSLY